MPTFMDFHDDLTVTGEAIRQITPDTRDGKADESGDRQVELFGNPDGKLYLLLEAPDANAVRKHHEVVGVPCGHVHEVSRLLRP